MSLSGRGKVAGEWFEFDVWVVVFDFKLKFLHPSFVVWEEGKVHSVNGDLSPRAVGDDGNGVAVRELLKGSKYGLLVLKDSFGCAVFS